jgi:hypothetical protein
MAKLDINTLLNNSIAKKTGDSSYVQESNSGLNIDLSAVGSEGQTSDCPGCGVNAALALNLENVAFQEHVQEFIGEDVINNIKGALGAGLATFAVLEARHSI